MLKRKDQIRNEEGMQDYFEAVNKYIDTEKSKGYKGTLNTKKTYRSYYDLAVKYRNDLKCVNTGQYRIIYDVPVSTNDTNTNIANVIDYTVKFQSPFYLNDESYFNEEDESIKNFLTECKKVGLSSNMALIPFSCKDNYYYITIDNLTKEITLDTVNTAYKHINKQSNLYYQIRQAITKELRNNYDEFEHQLLSDIRRATGINKRLLSNTFKNPEKLITSKYLHIIKKEQENGSS